MSTLTGVALIQKKLQHVSNQSGIYSMLDENNTVLYIGKAKHLKKRITSYTHLQSKNNRIAKMISLTHNMEFIITTTESDALLLEANLIKKFKPIFNIVMRDDKSLPYILLTRDHESPQLLKSRETHKHTGDYFGPFASVAAVEKTLNSLQRAFLLRSCSDSVYRQRSRPCMLYQIKRCSAPCTNEIPSEHYTDLVEQAALFLKGKNSSIQEQLTEEMQIASENRNYEKAVQLRDRIEALAYIQSKSNIHANSINNADIITLAPHSHHSCIQVFFFRNKMHLGSKSYFPKHDSQHSTEDILENFLIQFYDKRPAPKEILVNSILPQQKLLEDALSLKQGHKVKIHYPQRGEKASLINYAVKNAYESLNRHLSQHNTHKEQLEALATLLNRPSPIKRIDIFDNSHFAGKEQVGAMVVVTKEGFSSHLYRKFNIKTPNIEGDDYAMMREVLMRRYKHTTNHTEDCPDLILLDGGKGQLSIAQEVMKQLNLSTISLLAIAKGVIRNAGKEKFFIPNHSSFTLPLDSPLLYFLQRLRDTVHHFAITSHRAKRKKNIYSSPLDNIPMVGKKRKKMLLYHFGSTKLVMQATTKDLQKVKGISKKTAQEIYHYFHSQRS